jgi:hypothetical protein
MFVFLQDTEEMSRKALARVANETILRSKINQVASKYKNWNNVVAKFLDGHEKVPKNKTKVNTNEKEITSEEKKPVVEKQKVTKTVTSTVKPAKKNQIDGKLDQKAQAVAPIKKSVVSKMVKTGVVMQLHDLDDLEKLETSDKMDDDEKMSEKPLKKDSFFLTSDGYEVSSDEEPVAESESESEDDFQDRSYKSRAYHVRNKDNTEKPSMGSLNRHPRTNNPGKNFNEL